MRAGASTARMRLGMEKRYWCIYSGIADDFGILTLSAHFWQRSMAGAEYSAHVYVQVALLFLSELSL